ncbi:MAG TPA: hypothetical protein VJN39_13135 [Gemmatimonadales bacterium]|nr:hypothetical protein [Gemmatimonadales bacterium]
MFVVLAPVSLVALPFAALLLAARPASWRERAIALLAGGVAAALLLAPERGLLDGVSRAWIVLVSVAFAASATLRPGRFWPVALRSCLYAAAAVVMLARAAAGPNVWQEVQWEVTRDASRSLRYLIEVVPRLYPIFEPAVRVAAASWPLWLLLVTLAGLALAWRGYGLVAQHLEPLEEQRTWK